MGTWQDIYRDVESRWRTHGRQLFFRGHADARWQLMPSLGRAGFRHVREQYGNWHQPEGALYHRVTTRAGLLLNPNNDSWGNLFIMQHHGLPTRLLDWTRTFATAVYFAMNQPSDEAAVWVLHAPELNRKTITANSIPDPLDLPGEYVDWFLRSSVPTTADAIAVAPLAYNPRVASQQAAFTIHVNLDEPLELLHADVLTKIVIPADVFDDARMFLKLSGLSEFTMFPDLDGLSRELRAEMFGA